MTDDELAQIEARANLIRDAIQTESPVGKAVYRFVTEEVRRLVAEIRRLKRLEEP